MCPAPNQNKYAPDGNQCFCSNPPASCAGPTPTPVVAMATTGSRKCSSGSGNICSQQNLSLGGTYQGFRCDSTGATGTDGLFLCRSTQITSGGATPTPTAVGGAPSQPTNCGGPNQSCCNPSNYGSQTVATCQNGLYCHSDFTCSASTEGVCGWNPDSGSGTPSTSGDNCIVFDCGANSCNAGNQCTLNPREVPCNQAVQNLGGNCGQVDYRNTTGGYCGVMVQNCYGSCAGGVVTAAGGSAPAAGGGEPAAGGETPAPTAPAVGGGIAAACVATQLYLGDSTTPASAAQIASLAVGDTVRLAIKGNLASFTKGRFVIKLNNSVVATQETTTKRNLPGDPAAFEFIYDYTITQGGSYSVEGSIWQ